MTIHTVIVTGAAPIPADVLAALPSHATIVAVDGGLDHALAAGLAPDHLIGDLDSVSHAGLMWAKANATITQHPPDKDETDTELAITMALETEPSRLTMIGGGNRLDHTLAAIGALSAARVAIVPRVDAWWGSQHIDVLRGPGELTLDLEPDSTLSLLALGPACEGVSIHGVRWPLDGVHLEPVVGLGISNEVSTPDGRVTVGLETGALIIFDLPVMPAMGEGAS